MADYQDNYIYRIQTEGVSNAVTLLEKLRKELENVGKIVAEQKTLSDELAKSIQTLTNKKTSSSLAGRIEQKQNEEQIKTLSESKTKVDEYIKSLEKEAIALNKVAAALQAKAGVAGAPMAEIPRSLGGSYAEDAVIKAKRIALEIRKLKFEIVDLAQKSKESFKITAQGMVAAFAEQKRASMEYVFNRQGVEAEIRQYAKQTNEAARQLTQEEVQQTKYAAEIKKTAIKENMRLSKLRAEEEIKIAKEILKAQEGADGLAGSFGKLGEVAKFVFGSVFAISVIGILRSVVNWFKQAMSAGIELATSMYSLGTAIRAMQRVGVDITIGEVYENMERLRKEFGIFPWQDIVAGTAQIMNLTRSFKASSEELYKLQRAAFTLAVINNRSIADVQRVIALALSSGYTEGLQRLGISINKVTIANKALTLGWDKGYNSLTEYQRYISTQILILERVAAYEEDLLKFQESAPGRIKSVGAAWKDFGMHIGMYLVLPLANAADAFKGIIKTVEEATKALELGWQEFIVFMVARKIVIEQIKNGTITSLKEMYEAMAKYKQEARYLLKDEKESIRGKDYIGPPLPEDFSDAVADEMVAAYEQLGLDLYEAQTEYEDDILEAEKQFTDDMIEITNDYTTRGAEIWEEYLEEIKNINEEEHEQLLDAKEDLGKSIADVNKDFNEKIADENKKYREAEIQAEKDYQEQLRKLREEFLFDLEDALRKRDAAQIMRLIRRYNLDKQQLDRQKEEEKEERDDEHRDNLADLREERDKRIAELRAEYEERIAEIKEQAEKERIEAQIARDKERAEAQQDWQDRKKEREDQYEEEKQALKDQFEATYSVLLTNHAKIYNLTDEELAALGELYKDMFGPGGTIEGVFTYFEDMGDAAVLTAQQDVAEIRQALDAGIEAYDQLLAMREALVANPEVEPYAPGSLENPRTRGYASGGRLVATRPTLAMFGEVPEIVEFTPLSQAGNKGIGGRARIRIDLSPDLVGRIIDNTLGEIGDIQLEVQR